jgi:hypothetical protein
MAPPSDVGEEGGVEPIGGRGEYTARSRRNPEHRRRDLWRAEALLQPSKAGASSRTPKAREAAVGRDGLEICDCGNG